MIANSPDSCLCGAHRNLAILLNKSCHLQKFQHANSGSSSGSSFHYQVWELSLLHGNFTAKESFTFLCSTEGIGWVRLDVWTSLSSSSSFSACSSRERHKRASLTHTPTLSLPLTATPAQCELPAMNLSLCKIYWRPSPPPPFQPNPSRKQGESSLSRQIFCSLWRG